VISQANALEELRRIIVYMNQSGVPLPPGMAATCAAAASLPSLHAHFSQQEMHNSSSTLSNPIQNTSNANYSNSSRSPNTITNLNNGNNVSTISEMTEKASNKLIGAQALNCSQCTEKM
jgi:hypothetical protein